METSEDELYRMKAKVIRERNRQGKLSGLIHAQEMIERAKRMALEKRKRRERRMNNSRRQQFALAPRGKRRRE